MGNCVFRGLGGEGEMEVEEEVIKVVTSNGGIMELYAPITAECITNEFPGHGIFRRHDDLFTYPLLLHSEELVPGESYYLLPLNTSSHRRAALSLSPNITPTCVSSSSSSSSSSWSSSVITPYRMSFDSQGILKKSETELVPRQLQQHNNGTTGVWKVKLVISPEQLAEILSQEARTEALIESVRTVAKLGKGAVLASAANSDQKSISSSWTASSDRHGGLLDF